MKKLLVYAVLALIVGSFIRGQFGEQVVSVKVVGPEAELKRGETNTVYLEITVKEPYHINSDAPLDEFVVPTSIHFDSAKGLEFTSVEFPEAEMRRFNFSENPLSVYEGTFKVTAALQISSSYQEEEAVVSGTISYQACDDFSCLAPSDLRFSQTFPVTGEIRSGREKPAPVEQARKGEFAETFVEKGLFLTFILVFFGGLALNLTPCVYPIIPITIGYFGGQAEGRKGGIVAHALLYVLGMAATYSTLGVMAALTGSLFGAALQNPFVLIGIAVILIALALSMFNLYEFRLPYFLTRMTGGSKKGYFGTLFMGLTVGFVAAPCIGPFVLGLLTYVGEKGNIFLGFFMFFVLALGLGLPFLFLAIFSGSVNRLPKSGAWMVWVRTIFGFILVAMAVYFLGPLFPNVLVYNLAMALTLLVGGIYMAWIEPTKLEGRVFSLLRNSVGILFFVVALVFAVSGIQSYIDEKVNATAMEAGLSARADTIHWSAYTDAGLAKGASESKPVFVDFYADWCIPCKEMDLTTFVDPEVVEKSRDFIMLKMDLTRSANPFVKRVEKQYRVRGVPTYVFLKPDGTEIEELRTVGYVKADTFVSLMERAVELSKN
ncbi:MAG: protein-disulfide reductase DsbD [Candidatus Aminicenantes bacterium]|jgi:thiol:disulfide interchange protein DsbD